MSRAIWTGALAVVATTAFTQSSIAPGGSSGRLPNLDVRYTCTTTFYGDNQGSRSQSTERRWVHLNGAVRYEVRDVESGSTSVDIRSPKGDFTMSPRQKGAVQLTRLRNAAGLVAFPHFGMMVDSQPVAELRGAKADSAWKARARSGATIEWTLVPGRHDLASKYVTTSRDGKTRVSVHVTQWGDYGDVRIPVRAIMETITHPGGETLRSVSEIRVKSCSVGDPDQSLFEPPTLQPGSVFKDDVEGVIYEIDRHGNRKAAGRVNGAASPGSPTARLGGFIGIFGSLGALGACVAMRRSKS